MNEDLHDIDDLFRSGIEGHSEEVPPGVWEAVSNDLDKKQASYYKSKYKRLKRAALVLLFLCFLGGGYVLTDLLNDQPTSGVQKKEDETTSKTASTETSPVEKKNTSPTTTDKTNIDKTDNEQGAIEQKEKAVTPNATTPDAAPIPVEKGLDKQEVKEGKKTTAVVTKDLAQQRSSAIQNIQRKSILSREKESVAEKAKAGKMQSNGKGLDFSQSLLKADKLANNSNQVSGRPQSFSIRYFPLVSKDYQLPGLNLPAFPATRQSLLPEASKPAGSKAKASHDFSLSAFVAPNSNFDRLEDDDHLAGPGRNRQEAHREEQGNHSFSAGLLLNYGLSKNLSVQSGISITSSTTSIAPKTIYAKADNNGHTRYELHCSSGFAYYDPKTGVVAGDSARTSGTSTKLAYVTIPASINYRIGTGRFSLSPSVGAGLNILTSGKTKTSISDALGNESATTTISGLKPTYVDAHIGLAVEYRLNKTLSVGIRPNARLALTPINKETPVKAYQNFLSMETGIRIKL